MSDENIVPFLTDIECALLIALLEERRDKLLVTIRQTKNTGQTDSLYYLVQTTTTLLDKLQHASAVDHGINSRPE